METGKFQKPILSIRDFLSRILRYACAILIFSFAAIIFLQVLFRFFLQHPFVWAEELSRFLFFWSSILGAVLGIETKAHFNIDVFSNWLSPKNRRILDLAFRALAFFFLIVLTYESVNLTIISNEQLSVALDLPLSYIFVALPIGFFIMAFFLLFTGFIGKTQEDL